MKAGALLVDTIYVRAKTNSVKCQPLHVFVRGWSPSGSDTKYVAMFLICLPSDVRVCVSAVRGLCPLALEGDGAAKQAIRNALPRLPHIEEDKAFTDFAGAWT